MSEQETVPTAVITDDDRVPTPEASVDNTSKSAPETPASIPAEELQALRDEAAKNMQGWQRALADFQNYKRRVEREVSESQQRGALDALIKVAPMFDDFERALASIPAELEGNPWINGVSLIQNKYLKLLDEYGVTVIDPLDQPFDPSKHEAVGRDDDSGKASGTITAVLQKGFAFGERTLRPALVRVAG